MSYEKLVKQFERRNLEKEQQQILDRRKKEEEYKWQEVLNSPDYKRTQFWCNDCKLDFEKQAYKVVINTYKIGKYETRCPQCNSICRRVIGYDWDYFQDSQFIKEQRLKYAKDMLQPGDEGFDLLYGAKYRAMQKDQEKINWKKKLTMRV